MDHVANLTLMNAVMSPVETEAPVKMDSMSIFANADQVTKDVNVKERSMNVNLTHVNMEVPATGTSIHIRVPVPRDSLEGIAKKT